MIRRIITYLMSSGIAVLVDFGIFTAATHLGAGIVLATALGRVISSTVNFAINKKAVFQSEGSLLPQYLKYAALVIFSGSVSAFTVSHLVKIFPVEPVLIKAPVESLLFVFNYIIQHFFIFRSKKKAAPEDGT